MDWLKLSVDFDHHPQVMAAGWHGSQLFLLLLRLSSRFRLDGIIPAKFLSPDFLHNYWRAPPDFPLETAKRSCVSSGLIGETEDGGVVIDGWRRWAPREEPGASTERVRRFREMKRHETNGNDETARREEKRSEEKRSEEKRSEEKNKDSVLVQATLVLAPSEPPKPKNQEDELFCYWQTVHGHKRAKMDDDLRSVVREALRVFALDDLKLAVDGCKISPHHQGQNKGQTIYDSLELICRDAQHINAFIGHAEKGLVKPKSDVTRGAQRAGDWSNEPYVEVVK